MELFADPAMFDVVVEEMARRAVSWYVGSWIIEFPCVSSRVTDCLEKFDCDLLKKAEWLRQPAKNHQ